MKLEDVLSCLSLVEAADALSPEWQVSQQSMPRGDVDFLSPDFVRAAATDVGLPAEAGEAAAAAARRTADSPHLSSLIWHFHYRLFQSRTPSWQDIETWPTLEASLGDDAGAFYLVLLLSNLPALLDLHRSHRVPPEVTRDTLLDIRHWLEVERTRTGGETWGFAPTNVGWLRYHTCGDLYRLGRLQYQFGPLHLAIRVFRHVRSRVVLALSEDGVHYRPDGRISREGDADGDWTSSLDLADSEAIGNPILPIGQACRQTVRLPLASWRQVLTPGDPVLHIHIPSGGPMSHELCGESIRAAIDFFPRHFPKRSVLAMCCSSWILNTALETLLPETSNLVRFQREVYLVPTKLGDDSLLRNVFEGAPADLTKAARDTSLQRAILEVLESGRSLPTGGGGCFLLPDDFDWGAQVYRSQILPLAVT